MIWRSLAIVLAVCGSAVMQGAVTAQSQSLVLEDFQTKDAEGFPVNWEHENQRSQSKGRDAYKVQTEDGVNFLAVKDAGQRIKKKKIDWDPKAFPVLTWLFPTPPRLEAASLSNGNRLPHPPMIRRPRAG